MIQLNIQSTQVDGAKAEMFIDYQSESIGFTVITNESKQFDFQIEKDEWNQFKTFIEIAMKLESESASENKE